MKKILGIDPGSTTIAYGVIGCNDKDSKLEVIGYGYINLKDTIGQEQRLVQLHKDLKKIIAKYKPESVAIENLYFFKNAKTHTAVLQSKGVILFTAAEANLNIFEYTPLQVKQSVSGHGRADKNLVQKLVRSSLNIKSDIRPDDASDALAIAICHHRHFIHS